MGIATLVGGWGREVEASGLQSGNNGFMTGAFIVLEGGEGSGKSTQARLLCDWLRAAGHGVTQTFEPGATARGARIRQLLLDDDAPLDPRAELLLMAADRAQHVHEVVLPALAANTIVVSDRFEPSSLAYQGVGRGLGVETVAEMSAFARAGLEPDLVVVLDVADAVAAQRRPIATDRMERAGADFHAAVRSAYRTLAIERGWVVVDGDGTPEVVAQRVRDVVETCLQRVLR